MQTGNPEPHVLTSVAPEPLPQFTPLATWGIPKSSRWRRSKPKLSSQIGQITVCIKPKMVSNYITALIRSELERATNEEESSGLELQVIYLAIDFV